MNNNVKIFVLIIGLLILGTIAAVLLQSNSTPPGPGKYDVFAQCLKDKGAVFYGAFWCPHCQAEKKLFGSSVHLLPYVECSTPDASAQLQVCIDKKVASYPTWEFADGSRLTGEIPLQQLADKTSCVLPQ
jgi:thiol-disulfide isomerase/thioredoxin